MRSPSGDSATLVMQNSPVPDDGALPDNVYGDELVVYTIKHAGIQTERAKRSASL